MFNKIQNLTARIRPAATNKVARLFECALVVSPPSLCDSWRRTILVVAWYRQIPGSKTAFGVRFNCAEGEINDIATVFFVAPGRSIGWMFGMAEHVWGEAYGFTPQGLAIAAVCYLIMMAMAFGIAVPGGLFMPSLFHRRVQRRGCAGLMVLKAVAAQTRGTFSLGCTHSLVPPPHSVAYFARLCRSS